MMLRRSALSKLWSFRDVNPPPSAKSSLFLSSSSYQSVQPTPKPWRGCRSFSLLPHSSPPSPPRSIPGAPLREKITTLDLQKMRNKNKPISMVTAYTFPSAAHVDAAGIDVLLVGDSAAMVEIGHDTTLPITMDQMVFLCQAVARGASRPLLVADLPFGSYEASADEAFRNATRFLKEAHMDAVKLEGGAKRAETVRKLVDGGIAVMGHIGLTPQSISVMGGFRAQGRTLQAAKSLIADAVALEQAGAFALVIECVPAEVAQIITDSVSIPTIGIGAGPYCNGQVLVFHDMLGMMQHAHHAKVSPKFAKRYANLGESIHKALREYKEEVENGRFPGEQYSPYKLLKHEVEDFKKFADRLKGKQPEDQSGNQDNGTIAVY